MKTRSGVVDHMPNCGSRGKKTSQGRRNVGFSSMNKSKRRFYKAYRGQGR